LIVLVASGAGWEQAMDWRMDGSLDGLVRLRDRGANLRRFYGNPVAAPGHAELLTGRHFLRNGVSGDGGGEQLLHNLEVTLGEVCQDSGYVTGFFGWWRHGCHPPQHPVFQGFSEFAGRCRARWDGDRAWIQRGLDPEVPVADPWAEIGAAASAFVGKSHDRPFLCWVTVPPGEGGLAILNRIAGDLLAVVEADGRASQTLTILVSDRPDAYREAKLFGGPGSLSEGGVRIPGFWHWPGRIEPGLIVHDIAQNVDLFATAAALARARMPDDRPMDGMNLLPLLTNQRPERWPNRDIGNVVIQGRNPSSARTSFRNTSWLAVRDPGTRRNPALPPGELWELFDLQADPRQLYEVGEAYPFVLARLKSDFGRWYLNASQFDLQPVSLVVGQPGFPDLPLLVEYAESAGPSALRWHLQTLETVRVRVDWQAPDAETAPSWRLRIDGKNLTAERRQDFWAFGELDLADGKVEAVVEGVTEEFASAGNLLLRCLKP
jgi:arylsulfatase